MFFSPFHNRYLSSSANECLVPSSQIAWPAMPQSVSGLPRWKAFMIRGYPMLRFFFRFFLEIEIYLNFMRPDPHHCRVSAWIMCREWWCSPHDYHYKRKIIFCGFPLPFAFKGESYKFRSCLTVNFAMEWRRKKFLFILWRLENLNIFADWVAMDNATHLKDILQRLTPHMCRWHTQN